MIEKLNYSDSEIEEIRLMCLHDSDPEQNYGPGTFSCHEAMHMASYFQSQIAVLMEHPSIAQNQEWFKLAHDASNALWALYQSIGDDHLKDLRSSG